MKNRKREICPSGTVRDEDGKILIYSAAWKDGGVGALTMRAAGTLNAPFAWEGGEDLVMDEAT
jgi:hypothetical protein